MDGGNIGTKSLRNLILCHFLLGFSKERLKILKWIDVPGFSDEFVMGNAVLKSAKRWIIFESSPSESVTEVGGWGKG